ncbi:MAG: hypothetical protein N4A53_12825 [Pelagimonas sp.]|nr:hypothetical protein [Pelagimonas sp.]
MIVHTVKTWLGENRLKPSHLGSLANLQPVATNFLNAGLRGNEVFAELLRYSSRAGLVALRGVFKRFQKAVHHIGSSLRHPAFVMDVAALESSDCFFTSDRLGPDSYRPLQTTRFNSLVQSGLGGFGISPGCENKADHLTGGDDCTPRSSDADISRLTVGSGTASAFER